jgi:hypothetical protein
MKEIWADERGAYILKYVRIELWVEQWWCVWLNLSTENSFTAYTLIIMKGPSTLKKFDQNTYSNIFVILNLVTYNLFYCYWK